MNRKAFLQNSAIIASMYPLLNGLEACHVKKKGSSKKVFVLVQLIGGNDGLQTLIPLDRYPILKQARANLLIPEKKVLSLKGLSETGLHPAWAGIKDMYDNGLAGFIQGVGYEHHNMSHFRSSDIWLTGSDASTSLFTGWMARYFQTKYKDYPTGYPNKVNPDPLAIKIGDNGSFAFEGKSMDMSIVINPNNTFGLSNIANETEETKNFGDDEVKSIRKILLQTDNYVGVVKKALDMPFASSKRYPKHGENTIADQLKVVAQLIHGGLETSVYMVDIKGFDTHVEQVSASDTTKGVQADLLGKVSQAISCFWDDIVHMGREADVAGMAFSEFGRRIISTSGLGTDHGSTQPVLIFGANIDSQMIGKNPVMPDKISVEDNLPLQHDFKSVYSTILKQWFNAPNEVVKTVLPGTFETLDIFNG